MFWKKKKPRELFELFRAFFNFFRAFWNTSDFLNTALPMQWLRVQAIPKVFKSKFPTFWREALESWHLQNPSQASAKFSKSVDESFSKFKQTTITHLELQRTTKSSTKSLAFERLHASHLPGYPTSNVLNRSTTLFCLLCISEFFLCDE